MKTKPYRIKLSNEAEVDFDKSYEFYYEESPKVADAYFKSINLAFDYIKQNPTSFPMVHKDIRKYVVQKFPFVIYYRLLESTVQVIAIFHTSRRPEIWND